MDGLRRREVALLGALFLAGCASMPGKENVADFADALKIATNGFEEAIKRLAATERASQIELANSVYVDPTTRQTPSAVLPVPQSPNADAARRLMGDSLKVLATYAGHLTALASGEQISGTQSAVRGAVNRASATVVQVGNIKSADAGRVTAAFGGILNAVIEYRTTAAVNAAIRRAHPQVEFIAGFLSEEVIGRDGNRMVGAMAQNARAVTGLLRNSLIEIQRDPKVNAYQRDEAFRRAAIQDSEYQAALLIPEATRTALMKLVEAHAALLDPENAGPAVAQFIRAVGHVIDLYEAGLPAVK
jgi:hypothetical protein